MTAVLVALLVPPLSQAAGVDLRPDSPMIALMDRASFMEDPGASLGLNEVIAAHAAGEFSPLTPAATAQGISGSAFWVRLVVTNSSSRPLQWVLAHDYGFTQVFSAYEMTPEQEAQGGISLQQQWQLLEITPYSQRPVNFRTLAIASDVDVGESVVLYLRQGVNYANTQQLSLRIGPRAAANSYFAADMGFHAFFYGVLSTFVMVALITAVRSRSAQLGLYSAYLFLVTLSWAEMLGHLSQFVFPENPQVTLEIANWAILLTGAFMYELGRRFLRLASLWPLMNRVFKAAIGMCLLGIALNYVGQPALSTVFIYALALSLGVFPVVGLWLWRRIGSYVLWFVAGLSLHTVVLALQAAAAAGMFGYAAPYYTATQVALVLEASFLGMALAQWIIDAQRRSSATERAWRDAQRQSDIDSLTNLPNRVAFERRIRGALNEFDPLQGLHVVIVDIDELKHINSAWGHAAGDRIIRELGHLLTEVVRSNDYVARYRGASLAVLVTDTDLDSAELAINRIRERFASRPTTLDNFVVVRHTFSAGIATAAVGSTLADLLEAAQRRLQAAKHGGRDSVICSR